MNLYTARGEPARTIALPESAAEGWPRLAYDGARVVIADGAGLLIYEAAGRLLGRFTAARGAAAEMAGVPFLGEGRELLLFDGRRTFERYELP